MLRAMFDEVRLIFGFRDAPGPDQDSGDVSADDLLALPEHLSLLGVDARALL